MTDVPKSLETKDEIINRMADTFFPGKTPGEQLHYISKSTLKSMLLQAYNHGAEQMAILHDIDEPAKNPEPPYTFDELRRAKVKGAR